MNEKERAAMEQALEALGYENSWHESFKVRPYASTIDAVAALRAALAQPVQEPVSKMTTHRAIYFMERFKREEKLLGPNEQAALDFVISMLEKQAEPAQEPYAWHYTNNAGASVWHRGPSNRLDADMQAARDYPHVHKVTSLYTAPPRREQVLLTNEEIESCRLQGYAHAGLSAPFDFGKAARAVEKASLEKNK